MHVLAFKNTVSYHPSYQASLAAYSFDVSYRTVPYLPYCTVLYQSLPSPVHAYTTFTSTFIYSTPFIHPHYKYHSTSHSVFIHSSIHGSILQPASQLSYPARKCHPYSLTVTLPLLLRSKCTHYHPSIHPSIHAFATLPTTTIHAYATLPTTSTSTHINKLTILAIQQQQLPYHTPYHTTHHHQTFVLNISIHEYRFIDFNVASHRHD